MDKDRADVQSIPRRNDSVVPRKMAGVLKTVFVRLPVMPITFGTGNEALDQLVIERVFITREVLTRLYFESFSGQPEIDLQREALAEHSRL